MLTSQCTAPLLLFDSFNQILLLGRMNHNDGKVIPTLCCHDDGVRPSPYISEEAMKALWREIESVHEQAGGSSAMGGSWSCGRLQGGYRSHDIDIKQRVKGC